MVNANLTRVKACFSMQRTFKRRESIPLKDDSILWTIKIGAVRTFTLAEDDTIITLGFWGTGDTVGQPPACIQPYEVECLTDVEVCALQPDECWNLNQMLLSHLHQTQALLRIRSGQIQQRLRQFLEWLAYKFGCETDQGQLIELRLTHQDMADVVGTTRVTITRLLQQLEREGEIHWTSQHTILLYHR